MGKLSQSVHSGLGRELSRWPVYLTSHDILSAKPYLNTKISYKIRPIPVNNRSTPNAFMPRQWSAEDTHQISGIQIGAPTVCTHVRLLRRLSDAGGRHRTICVAVGAVAIQTISVTIRRKRSTNPTLRRSCHRIKLSSSRFQGSNTSMFSTVFALGSSLKT